MKLNGNRTHHIVSKEISEQILAGNATDRRVWKNNLSSWAIRLIEDLDALYDGESRAPSEEIINLLSRLFVQREGRNFYSEFYLKQTFSQLITDIQSPDGRVAVLESLVAHFPEPHFWAHLGRYYSLQDEHSKALNAIDEALSLENNNSVLHHMKGMALRNQVYELMDDTERERRKGNHITGDTLSQI